MGRSHALPDVTKDISVTASQVLPNKCFVASVIPTCLPETTPPPLRE